MSVSITRTDGLKPRATSAVSSTHPLQTTIKSSSPGSAPSVIAFKVRAITDLSLCAGMMIEIIDLSEKKLASEGDYSAEPFLKTTSILGPAPAREARWARGRIIASRIPFRTTFQGRLTGLGVA